MTRQKKVLILDDEAMIALDLAMMVEQSGHAVLGPFFTCDAAIEAISESKPDFAFLDVNLGRNRTSEPVAKLLKTLGVPFVFLTGYSVAATGNMAGLDDVLRVSKPFDPRRIEKLISEIGSDQAKG